MGWVILATLILALKFLVNFLRRLYINNQLTRVRFVIILTTFFSIIFFIGVTGLTT